MIKYNLKCQNNHEFESWFSDSKEFEKLKTRKMLFDMVSTDKLLCSGGHMLAPKFGYIEKSGTGYKFSE